MIVICKDCKEQMMDIVTNVHKCSATGKSYLIGSIVDESYEPIQNMTESTAMAVVKEEEFAPITKKEVKKKKK